MNPLSRPCSFLMVMGTVITLTTSLAFAAGTDEDDEYRAVPDGSADCDTAELCYMYAFADSYLLAEIERDLAVNIGFMPVDWNVNRAEREAVLIAGDRLPHVFSLISRSPVQLRREQIARSIPNQMIRGHMPGYSHLLTEYSEWSRLQDPDDPSSQLALRGHRYALITNRYSLAVRRHLAGDAFNPMYDSDRSVPQFPNLRLFIGPEDQAGLRTVTIDEVERALEQLHLNDRKLWLGRLSHLAPLYAAFDLPTIGGSVLLGHDGHVANFATDHFASLIDTLRRWHTNGYIHPDLLGGTNFPPSQIDAEVGMLTINTESIPRHDFDVPPLSWTRGDDSGENPDIVIIDATNIVSRETNTLFLTQNHQHESLRDDLENGPLIDALRIFEHVRVLLGNDHDTTPRYWSQWVYGIDGVHYDIDSDGDIDPRSVQDVPSDYRDYLSDREDRENGLANWHFKIPPLFSTEYTLGEYDDPYYGEFLDYIDEYATDWNGLPTFRGPDTCNVMGLMENAMAALNGIIDGVTREIDVVRGLIERTVDYQTARDAIEPLVSTAVGQCQEG